MYEDRQPYFRWISGREGLGALRENARGASDMVTVTGAAPGSRAMRAGIRPGDRLISINGHEIGDILDYRFFETERELKLVLEREGLQWSW